MVSSALETSVGIAAGVALAAALPELPYACGLATVQLLTDDVVADPLLPVGGLLPVGLPEVVPAALTRLAADPIGSRTGRRGSRGAGLPPRAAAGSPVMTPPQANPSTLLARAVVDALVEHGVREVVLAPGSRNAPLAFAAYDAAAAGLLRLHTRIDERTAGFLALGTDQGGEAGGGDVHLRHRGRQPAPGHARGRARRPALVVVTADRPASVRGTGANQTTDQVRIFGEMADFLDVALEPGDRVLHRLDAVAREVREFLAPGAAAVRPGPFGGGAGLPVHLNVQFDLPLVPDEPWHHRTPAAADEDSAERPDPVPAEVLASGPRTVVVAGDDAGPPARVLAQEADWPLFAEPTSGSRTGANALRCYRLLLDGELGREIERVVVCGHPTISRPVTRCWSARTSRWSRCAGARPLGRAAFPRRPAVPAVAVDGPADPAGWTRWRAADAERLPRPRPAAGAPRTSSRRTRSPAPSAAPYPRAGCCTSAPPARSATST